jgi:hypothetical protein
LASKISILNVWNSRREILDAVSENPYLNILKRMP